jgi:hypothetical protein
MGVFSHRLHCVESSYDHVVRADIALMESDQEWPFTLARQWGHQL